VFSLDRIISFTNTYLEDIKWNEHFFRAFSGVFLGRVCDVVGYVGSLCK
jgi:hypothetical protein